MTTIKVILKFVPWILLLLALLFWALGFDLPIKGGRGKTEVINSSTILERVERIGKLELVKYNFKEVFDYKAISSGKIAGAIALGTNDYEPDLKTVLIASGEAVGCIDLTKLKESDLVVEGDTLFVSLPQAELCYHKLDLGQTRVYHFERTGWWSKFFSDDEEVKNVIEKAYKNAEKEIEKAALNSGILEQTKVNGELLLRPIFEKVGNKQVVFLYRPQTGDKIYMDGN